MGHLESLIPATVRRGDGRGRLQLQSNSAVLNGILWIVRTGAAWLIYQTAALQGAPVSDSARYHSAPPPFMK